MSTSRLALAVGIVALSAIVISLCAGGVGAGEIPRKVNYQGKLADAGGTPLPGAHTVVFRIFDLEAGGTELWTETQPIVADSAGVFAAILGSVDSIEAGFDGPRWLEVAVDGETLTPRREMVSVPFAFQAANAHMVAGLHTDAFADSAHGHHVLDAADGEPADAVVVDDAGNVGVGTATPAANLDVAGTARVSGFEMPTGAAVGRVLTSNAAGAGTWQAAQAAPDGDWVISGGNMFAAVPGNVGVHTTAPQANLHVRGDSAPPVGLPPGTEMIIEDDDNPVMNFVSANTGTQSVLFGDPEDSDAGGIAYNHADNSLSLRTNAAERMAILSDGSVKIGSAAFSVTRLSVAQSSSEAGATAIFARCTSPAAQGGFGVIAMVATTDTTHGSGGVLGVTEATSGHGVGVQGISYGSSGVALHGVAPHQEGRNFGLMAHTNSPNGYAGYFTGGRNYFQGNVGIGESTPIQRLHVSDTAEGALKYAMKVENRANTAGTATGILFKVDTDLEASRDRGKGGIVYERKDTWNRGDFHILQDSGADTDVASLADAVVTIKNNGRVVIGTGAGYSKLYVNETSDQPQAAAIYATCSSPTTENAAGVIGTVESEGVSSGGVGVVGWATGEAGNGVGVWGDGAGATGSGVQGSAAHLTGRNFGVKGHTNSPNGYAGYFTGGRNYFQGKVGIGTFEPAQPLHVVNTSAGKGATAIYAHVSNADADSAFCIVGRTDSSDPETYGAAIYGIATSLVGRSVGVEGVTEGSDGFAVMATAKHSSGHNFGVYASTASPDGYAGYFIGGRNHFNGRVGIGLANQPVSMLHVAGDPVSAGGVSGYNEVEAVFRNPYPGHTAISVDAPLGRDAIIYLAEDRSAVWDLRNDIDGHGFQLRYQGGTGLGAKYMTVDSTGRMGVGQESPMQKLHVSDLASGSLKYALKLDNPGVPNGTATGILFKVDGNDVTHPDRGKGAIVYERKDIYNRGDFHILQDATADMEIAGLADAVVTIKNNGNVGIGTKSPGYKLQVGAAGDGSEARANAWNLLSSRTYKRDVEPLGPAQCQDILEKAISTDVVRYSFTNDPAAVEHLGVIAEDSPSEIVAPDGKGVSLGDYAAFLLAAIKAQQAEIEELRAQVKDLQSRVGDR